MSAAFPVAPHFDKNGEVLAFFERGMTLRDYFAAKALQGAIATARPFTVDGESAKTPETYSLVAYQMADAMLKARANTDDAALTNAYAEGRKDEREELKPAVEALSFAIRFFDQLTPADAERMRKTLEKAQGKS